MAKKIFTYILGTLILAPVCVGMVSGNFFIVCSTIIYALAIYYTARKNEKVCEFWISYLESIANFSNYVFGK